MSFGDLAEAQTAATIAEDSLSIYSDRIAADMPALELGSPHAGPDSLDDQVALQFGDGADDDDDGPAQRAGRIDRLAEADELDIEAVELIQDLEEVPGGAGDAIAESRIKLADLLQQIITAVDQAKWVDKAKIQQRKFQALLRSLTETSKVASEQLLNKDFERYFNDECKALRAPTVTLQISGEAGPGDAEEGGFKRRTQAK